MNFEQKKVVKYYHSLESRLGYTFLTWNTKHFGYYPTNNSHISEQKAQDLMEDLLAKKLDLKKGDFVLDAGCGRGVVSCYLSKKYEAKIIGIDLLDFELKMAKKRAQKLSLANQVKYFKKDYSNTKFPNNYFDAVYTMETLVHSPNIKKTLKGLFRVLKPGGKVVFFEYSRSYPKDFNKWESKVFNLIVNGSAMTGLKIMFHEKWISFIRESGFRNITDQEITIHVLPSLYRFYMLAWLPYLIIRLFSWQRYFINATAGVEFYKLAEKGLVRYHIFTAIKPS